ncbi:MAG: HlyD family type I secretion periplasmic adaptor subunit [Gammaproteobacteria bacterium]|nr:HlyD family type I secretion periplasmic adaptor subunit [Gammaproteobacteria bacterium]
MLPNLIERARRALPDGAPIEDAELIQVSRNMTDSRMPARAGGIILLLGLVGFLIWALVAPLDEGVPAPGTFTVASQRKTVQHLTGGIVSAIHVKEAQRVKAGEPLISLDDTLTKANFDAAKQQFYSLQAQADRLAAESRGAAKLDFSPELLATRQDPVTASYMSAQQQLFATRRAALQGELAILAQSERGAQEQVKGLEAQLQGKREQLRFVAEQLVGTRELAREGYLPRNRWFDEERLAADLLGATNELQSTILRAQSLRLEAAQRLAQRQRDFQKEVESQYAEVKREALVAANRLRATTEELERAVVRAPVDGAVVGLAVHSIGGVIPPGGRLLDVIPQDEALVLEVQVASHLIDRIHAGLPAKVQLHAFANDPGLILEAKVNSVSADLLPSNHPNIPPYYLSRVSITPEGMRVLGSRNIQPGMPAEVLVITGERTLMQYLLKPLTMRMARSLKES